MSASSTDTRRLLISGTLVAFMVFGGAFLLLARLPIDTLKIDRSFITDMRSSTNHMAIVSTIIALAHGLNLKVVAEGVETEEQAALLKTLGCDQIQGFLYSRPLPATQIEPWLNNAENRRRPFSPMRA